MVNYPAVITDFAPLEEQNTQNGGKPFVPSDPLPYTFARGDLLEISLFTEEEKIGAHTVVAPDGSIYFQFLEPIQAEGRTAQEVALELTEGLKKIYLHPNVTVIPKSKSEQYIIMGKVIKPGVYPLHTSTDLRSAIGEAGGLDEIGNGFRGSTTRMANLTNSFIVRDRERLNINFQSLIYEGNDSQNIPVLPDDYIYIASSLDEEVYIMGPFLGRALPFKDGLSLVSALAPVYGSYNRDPYARGNWRDVLIIRGDLNCPFVIRADFLSILAAEAKDIYLLPGDIIYVPNYQARFGRALLQLVIDAFVSGFTSSAAQYYINQVLD